MSIQCLRAHLHTVDDACNRDHSNLMGELSSCSPTPQDTCTRLSTLAIGNWTTGRPEGLWTPEFAKYQHIYSRHMDILVSQTPSQAQVEAGGMLHHLRDIAAFFCNAFVK
eukprot:1138027-Pelagomonas_calceolata.AAC.6